MKWLLGALALGGCGLLWLGYQASNDMTQSPDVRIGGSFFTFTGACALVLDVLLALIWLVMRA